MKIKGNKLLGTGIIKMRVWFVQ